MEQALQIREALIGFFKRYETIILTLLKLILGVIIFSLIGGIGQSMPVFEKISDNAFLFMLLLSIIFTVSPLSVGYTLIILYLGVQTSAVPEVAIIMVLFLLLVLLLYARLAPKEGVLILGMVIAYYFKLPYLVPIVAGLYFSLTSIIPITIAVFIWQYIPIFQKMLKVGENSAYSISELPEVYKTLYTQMVSALTTNQDWIVISFICAMVVVVVFGVSRLSINYAKDIAIVLGGVMTFISFIIAALFTDISVNMLGVLLSTIAAVAIAEVIRFFDVVLDYERVEKVQFQDEENVYYVKVVPKVIMSKNKRVARTIKPEHQE